MKKIISLVLAMVMVLSLCATAFAAENDGYTDPDADVDTNADTDVIWNFTGADENLNELDTDDALPLVTKFSDVKSGAWYYNDVTECAKLGIVQGFENGTFKPEDKVTGIQFIVMLTRTFYNEKVEAAKKTNNSTWYAPNLAAAKALSVDMTRGLTIEDKAMNRYDMAMALYNVISNEDTNLAMNADKDNTAKDSIKDWNKVPVNRMAAVPCCYALGIIQGMSDGTFSGSQSMTRAQACTVIMRMLKLLREYNPGDKDNDQYDDGQSQNAGKLTNGKDVTAANVTAMLKDIQRQYPTGTRWDASGNVSGNNWYKNYTKNGMNLNTARDVTTINGRVAPTLSLVYACGGWMCMVSEAIFGVTGAPCREVYNVKDAHPGDIVYTINTKTGKQSHVAIITEVKQVNGKWLASTCDGNTNGQVAWTWGDELGAGNIGYYGMSNKLGTLTYRIFTRYPA